MSKCAGATLVIVTALFLAPPAFAAWDATGHRTVAEIAWENMTPRARVRAVELLMNGPALANFGSLRPASGTDAERDRALFLNAATWADLVRNRNEAWNAYHHGTWHYADFYWEVENGLPQDIPGTGPDSQNAGERIVAFRATLADPAAADTTKAVALAWLLHLVGDIHQPLHCSARVSPEEPLPRGDEGGNTFHLDDNHNLHAYWDGILSAGVKRRGSEDSVSYAARLARRIQETHSLASLSAAAASTDVLGWEREGLRLAQTAVYEGVTRGATPPAVYEAQALAASERRIALAGYRLAVLLNEALR